jgi:hypothetical protein
MKFRKQIGKGTEAKELPKEPSNLPTTPAIQLKSISKLIFALKGK